MSDGGYCHGALQTKRDRKVRDAQDHHIREGRFARPHEHGAARSGNGVTASVGRCVSRCLPSPASLPGKRCGGISPRGPHRICVLDSPPLRSRASSTMRLAKQE